MEVELRTYTLNLLRKVQDRFNIPVGELLDVLTDGCCNHVRMCKRTGKPCACSRKAEVGGLYCRKHTQSTAEAGVELEYVEIQDKPYLYDPHTRRVYSYGTKSPKPIGTLSEALDQIIV